MGRTSIEQARHNESVCNYLGKKDEHSDWVITTAFYSAIHYVRHLMLSFTDSDVSDINFESIFRIKKNVSEGRHGFQLRYVNNNYNEIKYEYKRLHDLSENARYMNYLFTRTDATNAKEYLKRIKTFADNFKTNDLNK